MTPEQKIEAYLTDQLTGKNRSDFIDQVDNDPLLHGELSFHDNIITSIKEYRKARLKQRLNNISINTGSKYSIVKIASCVFFAVIITVGIYIYYNSPSSLSADQISHGQSDMQAEVPLSNVEAGKNLKEQAAGLSGKQAGKQEIEGPQQLDKKEIQSVPTKSGRGKSDGYLPEDEGSLTLPEKKSYLENNTNISESLSKSNESAPNTQYPEPKTQQPDIIDDFGDNEPIHKNSNDDSPDANIAQIPEHKLPDIEIAKSHKDDGRFYYQYYNDKLFLYGDFGAVPYELLEFNTLDEKLLYLFYDDTFYEIKPAQRKIKELVKITDKNMVKELSTIKNEKLIIDN